MFPVEDPAFSRDSDSRGVQQEMSAAEIHLHGSVDGWCEQKMSKQRHTDLTSGTVRHNSVAERAGVRRSVSGGGRQVFGRQSNNVACV